MAAMALEDLEQPRRREEGMAETETGTGSGGSGGRTGRTGRTGRDRGAGTAKII
jgi:hypothetical protein